MLFKWKNDWTVDNHRSHQWAWNGLTQGWDIQGDRLLVQGWPLDINEVILCTDNHTTSDRFYSHHGSHNGYMWVWYPSIILNWIWILVLIRWQASYTSQALEWRLLWQKSHEAQQACKSALIGPIYTGGLSHKHHKHDKINGSQRFLDLLSPRLMQGRWSWWYLVGTKACQSCRFWNVSKQKTSTKTRPSGQVRSATPARTKAPLYPLASPDKDCAMKIYIQRYLIVPEPAGLVFVGCSALGWYSVRCSCLNTQR